MQASFLTAENLIFPESIPKIITIRNKTKFLLHLFILFPFFLTIEFGPTAGFLGVIFPAV